MVDAHDLGWDGGNDVALTRTMGVVDGSLDQSAGLRRRRKLFVLVGLLAGSVGFGLVFGVVLVVLPCRQDPPGASIQPSPDWILQLGLALGAAGAFVIWRGYVHWRNTDEAYIDVTNGAANPALAASFLCVAGGLIVAAAFSPNSTYRDRPILALPLLVLGAIWAAVRTARGA